MALAIEILCFCPPDKSAPRSPTCYINQIKTTHSKFDQQEVQEIAAKPVWYCFHFLFPVLSLLKTQTN